MNLKKHSAGVEYLDLAQTADIADGAITTVKLADGSVTTVKLGDLSVTTAKLADGSVTTVKLGDLSVTTAKLADGSVTTVKLGDLSVTTAKLADGSVTTVKLADGSVTSTKIADGSIALNHLAFALGDATVRCAITYDFSAHGVSPNGIPSSDRSDDITLTGGEKVMVFQETTQTRNGVYIVSAGTWVRSSDPITPGMQIQVMSGGTIAGAAIFYCRNTTAPVIGTSPITFGRVKALPVDGSVGEAAFAGGEVVTTRVRASGASGPSVTTIGAAAGAGATAVVAGKDMAGLITVNTGTSPVVNDTLLTITFNQTYGAAPHAVILFPGSSNAKPDRVYVDQASLTASAFTIKVNGVGALDDSATLKWFYVVIA